MLDHAAISRAADSLYTLINNRIAEDRPRSRDEAQAIADELAGGPWEVRVEEAFGEPRFTAFVLSYDPHR